MKHALLATIVGALSASHALADPVWLPTGPFVDTTLHDGSRNGATNTLSANGRYAVYDADHSYSKPDGTHVAVRDIMVFDSASGTVAQITWGNRDSYGATISADGRYVIFLSDASDFSGRNKSITVSDVGVVTNPGAHVYLADLRTDLGHITTPTTYEMIDTSVLDAAAGCRASVPLSAACTGGDGTVSSATISGDGSYVAYTSSSLNLDADLAAGAQTLDRIYIWQKVSKANRGVTMLADGNSDSPSLNVDGSKLAFVSTASNLVSPAAAAIGGNVFLWDRIAGTMRIVSANGTTTGDGPSWSPTISANGAWIAYTTLSDNLDSRDNNGQPDVYAYEVASQKSFAVSVTRLLGTCKDGATEMSGGWKPICVDAVFSPSGGSEPSISGDGRSIAFMSASPLINQIDDKPGCDAIDHNGRLDIYVADMANGGEVTLQSMLEDATGKLWPTPAGESRYPTISADGHAISFESSNAAFYINDFESIADYAGDGAPKVFLLEGLQRRSCP
ncbi:MAG TPA: hypothetical protein VF132_08690 [Rudaea sp.]